LFWAKTVTARGDADTQTRTTPTSTPTAANSWGDNDSAEAPTTNSWDTQKTDTPSSYPTSTPATSWNNRDSQTDASEQYPAATTNPTYNSDASEPATESYLRPSQVQEEDPSLFETLSQLSPVLGMVAVAVLLMGVYWALCVRSSSSSSANYASMGMSGGSDGLGDGSNPLDEDEELGGTHMERGSKQGGFAALSNRDDDSTSKPASSSSGSFADEKQEGSAAKFLISVLMGLGLPSFGTGKYTGILSEHYLSTIDQLKQLDNNDWKRLGLPLVIEEALRKELAEHTNKGGKYAAGGGAAASDSRAKGLDLKSAAKGKSGGSSKDKKKSSGIAVAALAPSPVARDEEGDEPFAGADGSGDEEETETQAAPAAAPTPKTEKSKSKAKKEKGSKSSSKKSMAVAAAPVHQDAEEIEELDEDWMDKF